MKIDTETTEILLVLFIMLIFILAFLAGAYI